MQRFYNIDLSKFYSGELSLRRLSVLVAHLPVGSAIWSDQNGVPYGWTLNDLLTADLYQALTGTPHPARPSGKEAAEAERAKKLAAALKRQQERLNPSTSKE